MSCAACGTQLHLDTRSSLRSIGGRPRSAPRPPGVAIMRYAEGTPVEVLQIFPVLKGRTRGRVALALVPAAIALPSTIIQLIWPQPDSEAPQFLVLGCFVAIAISAFFLYVLFRDRRREIRLAAEELVVSEDGRVRWRGPRASMAQIACRERIVRTEDGRSMAYDLVGYDRHGATVVLFENLDPEYAIFAELWLEEQLGIPDGPAVDEHTGSRM